MEIIDHVLRAFPIVATIGGTIYATKKSAPRMMIAIQATVVCVTFLLSPYLYCSEYMSSIIQFNTGYRLVRLAIHEMLKHRLYKIISSVFSTCVKRYMFLYLN